MKAIAKIAAAAALSAAAGVASAAYTPFFIDVNQNFGGAGPTACATCTGTKDEFQFFYKSSTTIFDTGLVGQGAISAGDLLVTNAGLAAGGGWDANAFSKLLPAGTKGQNGLGVNWNMSFSIAGLNGIVTGVNNGVPTFAYGPGLLEMYFTLLDANGDPTTVINFMDIVITGGGATGVSTVLLGNVDFSNVDAAASSGPFDYRNMFKSATSSCGGDAGFYALSTCGNNSPVSIAFLASFDTNVSVGAFTPNDEENPTSWNVTSNHDGSAGFTVPEPGTLALAGLALIGVATAGRRKA